MGDLRYCELQQWGNERTAGRSERRNSHSRYPPSIAGSEGEEGKLESKDRGNFQKAESSLSTQPARKWRHRSYISKELNISSKHKACLLDPSKNISLQQPDVSYLRHAVQS